MNCVDIITRAYRMIGVVGGGQLPRETEQNDGLDYLKGLYRRLITDGAFGTLVEVTPTDPFYVAGVNQRITPDVPDCVIEFPRNHSHHAVICVVDTFRRSVDERLFDANTKLWQSIDDLQLTSAAPLAHGDPTGLAAMLAIELSTEFGQTPTAVTVQRAASWQSGLVHSWSAEDVPTKGVYF